MTKNIKKNFFSCKGALCRAYNIIFQVYQYFTIYRWYFLSKSGGTKDYFRQVKVPGTAAYWKACLWSSSLAKGYDPLNSSSPLASLVGFS